VNFVASSAASDHNRLSDDVSSTFNRDQRVFLWKVPWSCDRLVTLAEFASTQESVVVDQALQD
jgi:hypothetical protein